MWAASSQPAAIIAFDVARVEIRAFRLEVEHARPAVLAQLRQREGELGPVAVVEGEDDRLRRQGAAVVPGVLDLFERHRLVAVFFEPVHLVVEVGAADVELGVGRVFRRGAEHVVLEDRHRPGVRLPVGLRGGVADQPGGVCDFGLARCRRVAQMPSSLSAAEPCLLRSSRRRAMTTSTAATAATRARPARLDAPAPLLGAAGGARVPRRSLRPRSGHSLLGCSAIRRGDHGRQRSPCRPRITAR